MKMRRMLWLWVGLVIPMLAWAATTQVGMVLAVQGEVQLASRDLPDKRQAVKPMMLVQEGDHLFIPAEGNLRMVFHANGRKELWSGAALHLQAEREGSKLLEGRGEPKVERLPAQVAGAVVQAPAWLASASRKTGGLVVRDIKKDKTCTPPEDQPLDAAARQELQTARGTYDELSRSDPMDPTPDLYLFALYAKHGQYSEMFRLLETMKQRPREGALTEHLQAQMARLCR